VRSQSWIILIALLCIDLFISIVQPEDGSVWKAITCSCWLYNKIGIIYVRQIIGLLIALSKMPKTECSFHLLAERFLHMYCQELPISLKEYDNYHKEFSKKTSLDFRL
jgi:hypothetical protein